MGLEVGIVFLNGSTNKFFRTFMRSTGFFSRNSVSVQKTRPGFKECEDDFPRTWRESWACKSITGMNANSKTILEASDTILG